MTKAGTRVLISQDCREGGKATGQTGIYEGDFPLSVVLTNDGGKTWSGGEYDYDRFIAATHNGRPATEAWPLWDDGEQPGDRFAMVMKNPRIRLDDGSIIWGCECWWGKADEGVTLEDAQEQTEEMKQLLRDVYEALAEDAP